MKKSSPPLRGETKGFFYPSAIGVHFHPEGRGERAVLIYSSAPGESKRQMQKLADQMNSAIGKKLSESEQETANLF